MTPSNRAYTSRVYQELASAQAELDSLILRVPTGEERNELTDINIELLSLMGKIDKLRR